IRDFHVTGVQTCALPILGAAQALVYLLCILLMLRLFEPGVPLAQSLGLRSTHALIGVIGVGLGLCLKLPAEWLTRRAEAVFPAEIGRASGRASIKVSRTI